MGWDPSLNDLPCVDLVTVVEQGVHVPSGQQYWRLIQARWLDPYIYDRHHIYVDVLDESGSRIFGVTVALVNGGLERKVTEPQPPEDYPWDYPAHFDIYSALCSYAAYVEGLPSDRVVGMGLGTAEHPNATLHSGFVLVFQRAIMP